MPEPLKYLGTGGVAAFHLSTIVRETGLTEYERVVVEGMRLTTARDTTLGKAIATANDLIGLTAIAAYIAGQMRAELVYVAHPACSKAVTKARCEYVLTEAEKALARKSLGKAYDQKVGENFFDSCFHLMRAVGRFGR